MLPKHLKLLESISYDLTFFGDSVLPKKGEHDTRRLVVKVLTGLHPKTRRWVLDTIIFIGLSGQHGEHLPIKLSQLRCKENKNGLFDVPLVVFSEMLMRLSLKEASYIIAHEIAHVWLKHESGGAANERAADNQAAKWGFPPSRQRVCYVDKELS